MKFSSTITENVTATFEISQSCNNETHNVTINNFISGNLFIGSFDLTKEDLLKLKEYIDEALSH